MNFLSDKPGNEFRWQAYQELELLPDSVSQPNSTAIKPIWGLTQVWRGFLNLLMDELVTEQQIDYLERCWSLNESEQHSSRNTLKRLWVLME
jgi:hypothetical protein